MPRLVLALSLLAASAASAAPAAEPPRAIPSQEVPAGLAPAVAKGDAAMNVLRDRFLKRLNALMVQGGPREALVVCPTEAPRMAKEVGEVHKVEIGRTSFRVRNRANAPRPWAAPYVNAAAGKKLADVQQVVFDLGDRVGVLRPMVTMPACARCHGAADAIDPDVKAEIARRYPQDQGIGFAVGDVRGFIWVEVKKQ